MLHLDDAGSVRELWFSPPGRMPLGASFGAATLDQRLLVTLRYRHTLLDATECWIYQHGLRHMGEIELARGLVGLGGMTS